MAFLPIAAAAITAGSGILGGLATAGQANYNARVAKNNATIANQNAVYSEEAGEAKTQAQGQKEAGQLGAIKTGLAANGVDVNSGSALDVQTGQRATGALDEQTIANNTELEAYGYRSQATGYEATAKLDSAEAAEAPIGAALGATGTLLGNPSVDSGLLGAANSLSTKWSGGLGGGSNNWSLDTGTVAGV